MTVYQETREWRGVLVSYRSSIADWPDWPDDVREILRAWNRQGNLRFVPTLTAYWTCPDCRHRYNSDGSTAAKIGDLLVCDDCVIARARRYGLLGRAETELEKAKRWQRNMQKKLLKYRHNAIQERLYVARLKAKLAAAEDTITTHGLDDEYAAVLRSLESE